MEDNGSLDSLYHSLFAYAPDAMLVEDFSGVRACLAAMPAGDGLALRGYLEEHPEEVERCLNAIRVLDVNIKALQLYGMASRQ